MTGLALLNKSGHKFRLSLVIAVASFLWTITLQTRAVPEDDVFQQAVNYIFTGKIDPGVGPEIVDRKSCVVVVPEKFGGYARYYLTRFKMDDARIIPGLRDDPKIVGRDDTKVVGDSVAKAVPFFGNSSPKEAQDCRSELGEGFIASIIGDMFVHYAPASFDRIKMRTIGRDEVQPDPASRLPQPLTHQNRVVVGGVVKKDVDPFLSRIGGFDGDQQCDQAHRVNLRGLQHLRLPGLQIDRAMDVQALAPGGLLDPRPRPSAPNIL